MVITRFFDEVIDFLTSFPRPEDIVAFKLSAALQSRTEDLLDKKREDALTPDEAREGETHKIRVFEIHLRKI